MVQIASELLVERLADWGVDTVFGLPGDGIIYQILVSDTPVSACCCQSSGHRGVFVCGQGEIDGLRRIPRPPRSRCGSVTCCVWPPVR
jgi:hypothetical protein